MFTTARTPIRNTLTAVAATFVCTAATLVALDSPAHAATTGRFVRSVERQLDQVTTTSDQNGVATVAVLIDSRGRVVSVGLVGSTGQSALDREAVQTAKSIVYPKGDRSRTVAVVLKYGSAAMPSKAYSAALASRYANAHGEALADRTPAPNAG